MSKSHYSVCTFRMQKSQNMKHMLQALAFVESILIND